MIFKNFFILIIVVLASTSAAYSQIIIPDKVKQGIVIDHSSGAVLAEKNADQKISPASMTKIMTAVVVFDQLKNKKIKLTDQFTVSKKARNATRSGESTMFVVPGDKVSIEDLLRGVIIISGVDASIVLAEGISGTEEQFVNLMNEKAKQINMVNTNFSNSSGTYSPDNYSTVRDIALLIAVISGLPTMSSRAESSKLLLNGAFNKIDLVKIPYDKDKFKIKIWNGSSSYLDVKGANKDGIFVNLPKNLKNPKIKMELEYEYPLQLPIKKFEKVAVLRIYKNKELIETEDLFAQKDITDKNIFFKGIQNINHYLWQ